MATKSSYEVNRANFENVLAELIRSIPEEQGITSSEAFNRVAAEWLGYDLEEEAFVDGAGDRGIDFWFAYDKGFDIFQSKMHELNDDGTINRARFDASGVQDLQRARTFLIEDAGAKSGNEKLKELKSKWDFAISGQRTGQELDPIVANLNLLVLGDGLTKQADEELQAFAASLEDSEQVGEVPIQFRPTLYTLDTLIDSRWREENREWRDKSGAKRDAIELRPYDEKWIGATNDVVFYSHAFDLVGAYEDLGYQVFEPNVRAHIGKSKINAAIEESVKRRSSRQEFRLLNNGVTITCSGYSKPSENRPLFNVREPGVVNGLQTVIALHSGYQQLSHTEKKDFEDNCFVLVRLLNKQAVDDIGRVVLATNNQNPMQPRNLISNRSEQIIFEQLFAEKGWFYERKQGAWDAFYSDPARWRTLPNKKAKHFRVPGGKGRPKYRRVDNEDMAQTWLAFMGFSKEAANLKRELFDDKWYEFIFLKRFPKHGFDYDYSHEEARTESSNIAPNVDLMLLSYLARELAKKATPSGKKSRETALKRLKIKADKMSKEEIDVKLARDHEYTLGQALRGSSLLFVELLGYILYRSLVNPHEKGSMIFNSGIAERLRHKFDLDEIVQALAADDYSEDDPFAVIWNAFLYTLDSLVLGPWGDSYRAAPVKVRFLLSEENRRRFVNEIDQLDEFLIKRELARPWATGITEGLGLYGFVSQGIAK